MSRDEVKALVAVAVAVVRGSAEKPLWACPHVWPGSEAQDLTWLNPVFVQAGGLAFCLRHPDGLLCFGCVEDHMVGRHPLVENPACDFCGRSDVPVEGNAPPLKVEGDLFLRSYVEERDPRSLAVVSGVTLALWGLVRCDACGNPLSA